MIFVTQLMTVGLLSFSPANVHARNDRPKMHARLWCILAFVSVILYPQTKSIGREFRLPETKGFLFYRTNSINQRACTCSTTFSCSCCETVTLLYSKLRKTLCSNFMFQRNGLNVDISLNTDTIRTTTVSVYRPFKLCTSIPGSFFSSICVNIVELNQFPRSLTVCVRHEIVSKVQEWQINYTCVSISTELPSMEMSTGMTSIMTGTMTGASTMRSISQMTMATATPAMMITLMSPSSGSAIVPGAQMTTMSSGGQIGSMTSGSPSTGGGGTPSGGQMGPMSPPGSQMGSMPPGPPTGPAGGGEPSSTTGIVGARRRRHASDLKFYKFNTIKNNYRAKIINRKPAVPNLHLEDSMTINIGGPVSAMSNISKVITTSGASMADRGIPVRSVLSVKNIEKPLKLDVEFSNNKTDYFPSRIPPAIAKTLKKDKASVDRHKNDALLVTDDLLTSSLNTGTSRIIFPD